MITVSCDATIVIATFRRPPMLEDTLESLCRMRFPDGRSVEVLVIDNDEGRSAQPVADRFPASRPLPFSLRYIHEPRTGLSHARNRGIEESRGRFLIFLDDDVFVDPEWLTSFFDAFESTGAECIGGRTLVRWEGAPDPLLKACETELVAIDFGETDMALTGARLPGGGNAGFRRDVFEDGLRFSHELGRIGTVLLSGEDTELMTRLRRAGGRIHYCAKAVMHHRTQGPRLTTTYAVKRRYWFGVSFAVIDRRLDGRVRQCVRAGCRLGKALLWDVPRWIGASLSGNRRRRLLAACDLAKQFGYARATVSRIHIANPT
ncbi:MAG: glycosyltransferase family 2 protein [Planctomycetes bacterium]|nr:glycosyltransferase family 2 protein [Planctomycetota bacterium]